MKKMYRSLLMALAVMMIFAFAGCAPAADQAISVKTATAQIKALDSDITVNGILLSQSTTNVASKLAGSFQVTAMDVVIGSVVRKGDVLATLDTAQLEAQLAQAEAQLNAAEVAVKAAKSGRSAASSGFDSANDSLKAAMTNQAAAQATYNSLAASGTATATELTQATMVLQQANSAVTSCSSAAAQLKASKTSASGAVNTTEANVEVAQASIELIKLQIANATITSPIDGILISKNISIGEMAAPSAPLFSVADNSTLTLKGTVSEEALLVLAQGQSVDISVDIYPGKAYTGTVTMISPIAVSTGKYFPVEISLRNGDGFLQAGLSASASIKVTGAQNIIVPASAIITQDGESFVYVLENAAAVKKPVKTGLSSTSSIEILSGLSEGEKIITSNVSIISDGMQVNEQNGGQA